MLKKLFSRSHGDPFRWDRIYLYTIVKGSKIQRYSSFLKLASIEQQKEKPLIKLKEVELYV